MANPPPLPPEETIDSIIEDILMTQGALFNGFIDLKQRNKEVAEHKARISKLVDEVLGDKQCDPGHTSGDCPWCDQEELRQEQIQRKEQRFGK